MKYVLVGIFLFGLGFAQERAEGLRRCDFDERVHEEAQNRGISAEELVAQYRAPLNYFISRGVQEEVVAPVVFHVLYSNSTENIPDSQILEQLQILNEAYSATNTELPDDVPLDFQSVIGNPEIRFVLASTDPEGNPTNGITRTETTITSFANQNDDLFYTSSGGIDAWNPNQYINIYIADLGNQLLGFASPPFFAGNPDDAIAINYRNIGNTNGAYDMGRTLVHEMGHYFSLSHVWGLVESCSADDGLSDTPNQENPNYGVGSYPSTASCNTPDMWMNYMDYSDDEALIMFTTQQSTEMVFSLTNTRASLLSSPGLSLHEEQTDINNDWSLLSTQETLEIVIPNTWIPESVEAKIIDASGKVIQTLDLGETPVYMLSTFGLPKGVVFVQLFHDGNVWSKAALIQ